MSDFALARHQSRYHNLLAAVHSELLSGRTDEALREIELISDPYRDDDLDDLAEIIADVRDAIDRGDIQYAVCVVESARFKRDDDEVRSAYDATRQKAMAAE